MLLNIIQRFSYTLTLRNLIRLCIDNINVTNKNLYIMNELLNYIDFAGLCDDNDLTSGDITPFQTTQLETILKQFINQNK